MAELLVANIRINKRIDRFTLRGKGKVNIHWLLYCQVHNLKKIMDHRVTSVFPHAHHY